METPAILISKITVIIAIKKHINAEALLWFLPAALLVVLNVGFFSKYKLSYNLSESLEGTIFLVERGVLPDRGEFAEFFYNGDGIYQRGTVFIKIAAGIGGDIVATQPIADQRTSVAVNGRFVGNAKPYSRTGIPLKPTHTHIIKNGHYYMAATHPDSFDSRYAVFGEVTDQQIIGRAVRLF